MGNIIISNVDAITKVKNYECSVAIPAQYGTKYTYDTAAARYSYEIKFASTNFPKKTEANGCNHLIVSRHIGVLFVSPTCQPATTTELHNMYAKALNRSNYRMHDGAGMGSIYKIAIEPMGTLLGIPPEEDAKIAMECVISMLQGNEKKFTTIEFTSTDPKVLSAFNAALLQYKPIYDRQQLIYYKQQLTTAIYNSVEHVLPEAINKNELINALSKEMLGKIGNEYAESNFPIQDLEDQLTSGLENKVFVTGKWTLSDVKALVSEIFKFLISCGKRGDVKDTWNKTHYSLNTKNITLPPPPQGLS